MASKNTKSRKFDLSLISKLPLEIEIYIQDFLPIEVLCSLTKKYYIKYHKCVKNFIPKNLYDNYIRDMIRRDNDFVFGLLIKENCNVWLKIKKYKYKNTIYDNFIWFLDGFCIENKSTKCRNLLNDFFNKTGLSKNKHKKNSITNIIWSN